MENTRGSIWRRWDLHAHTPLDHEWIDKPQLSTEEHKQAFARKYIAFAKQQGLEGIGITDHNFCNSLDDCLIQHIQIEATKEGITILPGFEITAKDGSGIHLLVLFNEHTQLSEIKAIVDQLFTPGTELMPDTGIVPVSNKTIDEIKDIVDSAGQEAIMIFAHADRENGVLDKGTIKGTRRVEEWHKDYIKICQLSKPIYELTEGTFVHNVVNGIDKNYRKEMAYIVSSDCRSINHAKKKSGRNVLGEKFVWIKGDPTFEGVKQIMYDAENRVRVQTQNPSLQYPKLALDSIEITNSKDFPIVKQNVVLNPDLVCLIGGRGSGKSALVETIAFCFDEHRKSENDDQYGSSKLKGTERHSFIDAFQASNAKATIKLSLSNLDDKIEEYHAKIHDPGDPCSFPLLYLGQNTIEKYSGDPDRIHQLAFSGALKDSSLTESIVSKQQEIQEVEEDIARVNAQITQVRDNYNSDEYAEIKRRGDKLRKELQLLESKETKKTLEELATKRHRKDVLDQAKEAHTTLKSRVDEFKLDMDAELQVLNNLVKELDIRSDIELDLRQFEQQLKQLEQKLNKSKIPQQYENAVKKAKQQLDGKTDVAVEYIENIKSQLNQTNLELGKHDKANNQLEKHLKNREKALERLEKKYKEYHNLYSDAINEFMKKHSEILEGIDLTSEHDFDFKDVVYQLYNMVDRRKAGNVDKLISKIRLDINDKKAYPKWVSQFLSDEKNFDIFNSNPIEDYERILCRNHHKLITRISYELPDGVKMPIDKLSLGQKGTVLLKLYLTSGSNCPIIIDQPEDHLDNDFIYTDLVGTFRSAKQKRQIIVVTHDANLVVNGDAEQVIVAEYSDERINHSLTGAIENPVIRERVTQVLEGGKEAFTKREAKYQIKA